MCYNRSIIWNFAPFKLALKGRDLTKEGQRPFAQVLHQASLHTKSPEGATSFTGMMSPLQGSWCEEMSHLEWATPIIGVISPFQG